MIAGELSNQYNGKPRQIRKWSLTVLFHFDFTVVVNSRINALVSLGAPRLPQFRKWGLHCLVFYHICRKADICKNDSEGMLFCGEDCFVHQMTLKELRSGCLSVASDRIQEVPRA